MGRSFSRIFGVRHVRTRLTFWYVSVLASVLVLSWALTASFLFLQLRSQLDHYAIQDIETVEGDALNPPPGPFVAVVERHLLWTLPAPAAALAAWHAAAPDGRLVAIEGSWGGRSTTGLEGLRSRARVVADRIRRTEPGHHGHYSERLRAALPHREGLTPAAAVTLVEASPWGPARIERLRDVEWAVTDGRGLLDDILGTHPRWAVVAGR